MSVCKWTFERAVSLDEANKFMLADGRELGINDFAAYSKAHPEHFWYVRTGKLNGQFPLRFIGTADDMFAAITSAMKALSDIGLDTHDFADNLGWIADMQIFIVGDAVYYSTDMFIPELRIVTPRLQQAYEEYEIELAQGSKEEKCIGRVPLRLWTPRAAQHLAENRQFMTIDNELLPASSFSYYANKNNNVYWFVGAYAPDRRGIVLRIVATVRDLYRIVEYAFGTLSKDNPAEYGEYLVIFNVTTLKDLVQYIVRHAQYFDPDMLNPEMRAQSERLQFLYDIYLEQFGIYHE